MVKPALKQVYKYRNDKTSFYCNYLGKAKYKRGTYKREWFESTKRVPFENITLRVPEKVEDFLSERFGNYMEIPSLEQIKREQHASVWDTEKDFTEYVDCEPTIDRKYLF